MGPQEVAEALAPGGFAIGIAGCPQHRHKDLGLANLAGAGVNDWHRGAGIIDKELVTSQMVLAHAALETAFPRPIVGAELGILINTLLVMRCHILLPQQL